MIVSYMLDQLMDKVPKDGQSGKKGEDGSNNTVEAMDSLMSAGGNKNNMFSISIMEEPDHSARNVRVRPPTKGANSRSRPAGHLHGLLAAVEDEQGAVAEAAEVAGDSVALSRTALKKICGLIVDKNTPRRVPGGR